jgi:hypothetical protein
MWMVGLFDGRYIFFEKKRIAEGKPKSAGRLRLEPQISEKDPLVYEIKGVEEECYEDSKGRLIYSRTGKVVKLM